MGEGGGGGNISKVMVGSMLETSRGPDVNPLKYVYTAAICRVHKRILAYEKYC